MNRAIIQVTGEVVKHLGVLEANEDWRKALLLSEDYVVDQVTRINDDLYHVAVDSNEIPDGCEYMKMSYKLVEGKVKLMSVVFTYPPNSKNVNVRGKARK